MNTLVWKTPKGIDKREHPFYDFYLILNTVAEECHTGTEMNSFNGAVPIPLSQGGIRRDNIPYTLKKDFKGYLPSFYEEFPQMPNPFSGTMELHLAESVLREVRFLF